MWSRAIDIDCYLYGRQRSELSISIVTHIIDKEASWRGDYQIHDFGYVTIKIQKFEEFHSVRLQYAVHTTSTLQSVCRVAKLVQKSLRTVINVTKGVLKNTNEIPKFQPTPSLQQQNSVKVSNFVVILKKFQIIFRRIKFSF